MPAGHRHRIALSITRSRKRHWRWYLTAVIGDLIHDRRDSFRDVAEGWIGTDLFFGNESHWPAFGFNDVTDRSRTGPAAMYVCEEVIIITSFSTFTVHDAIWIYKKKVTIEFVTSLRKREIRLRALWWDCSVQKFLLVVPWYFISSRVNDDRRLLGCTCHFIFWVTSCSQPKSSW